MRDVDERGRRSRWPSEESPLSAKTPIRTLSLHLRETEWWVQFRVPYTILLGINADSGREKDFPEPERRSRMSAYPRPVLRRGGELVTGGWPGGG